MGPPLQQGVSIVSGGCLQVAGLDDRAACNLQVLTVRAACNLQGLIVRAAFVLMCHTLHRKLRAVPCSWDWVGLPLQQSVSIASAGCLQFAGYMLVLIVGAALVLMCHILHKKRLPWP